MLKGNLETVFKWCTAYSEEDVKYNPARKARRIIYKGENEVIFEDAYWDESVLARKARVKLYPPDRWDAELTGQNWEGRGIYRLIPQGEHTRVDITFEFESESITPEQLKERVQKVWANHAKALEQTS